MIYEIPSPKKNFFTKCNKCIPQLYVHTDIHIYKAVQSQLHNVYHNYLHYKNLDD